MTTEWPPPPDAGSGRLLNKVDTMEMPHAKQFAACLEALASSSEVHAWTPCIGSINGVAYEFHNHGVPNGDYQPSTIPVATPDDYLNSPAEVRYVSTVIEHLGTSPEHFMAFAQVLSGQDLSMSGAGYAADAYSTPIDWAYYNLAFSEGLAQGSASKEVKEALADYAALNSAQQAVLQADWDSTAQNAAAAKFNHLMNFLLHLRGKMHAEFGATLVAYVALVKAARKQLDGLMAQADAAMRRLEAAEGDLVTTLATLLTLAGFMPGLPYAISFGIAAASGVVSKIESKAEEKKASEEIKIPDNRSHSCVDILRWYLEQARATCEDLADGISNLSKRLPALLDEVENAVPQGVLIPDELRRLPN